MFINLTNITLQFKSLVNLLIERRLQERFGTCKTYLNSRDKLSDFVPIPAIVEKDRSKILTLKFSEHGESVTISHTRSYDQWPLCLLSNVQHYTY